MATLGLALQRALDAMGGLQREEAGQELAEYGLILALVAVVVVAAVTLLGTNINAVLNSIASSI